MLGLHVFIFAVKYSATASGKKDRHRDRNSDVICYLFNPSFYSIKRDDSHVSCNQINPEWNS